MSKPQTHTIGTGKPTPEDVKGKPILERKIWDRMHKKDKNYMGIITGPTGSGKSEYALRIAEMIDPDFSVDKVAFTLEEFLRLVNEDHPPGSAIVFDEVGIALSHAQHYDENQIRVNHILQSWRSQNRMLLMTAPHIGLVQKSDRSLLHARMKMENIDYKYLYSNARYQNLSYNEDAGKIIKPYPKLESPEDGRTYKYTHMALYKPTPAITEPYKEKKEAFNEQLNKDVLAEVTGEERDSMDPDDVVEDILEHERVGEFVTIHGGWNKPQLDDDLIYNEYDSLSRSGAKTVKKLLSSEDSVDLATYE